MEAHKKPLTVNGDTNHTNRHVRPGEALDGARLLPLDLIDPNPRQNRQAFDVQALEELADSIRQEGVLQPILVRPQEGGRFIIVAGERRWRASQMAGLENIPAIIMERDDLDSAFATAIENIQREQLDIEDEARTFAYLIELSGLSQRKLAKRLGLNHVYVSRRIKLLKRPDLMQAYREGQLTLSEVLGRLDQPVDGQSSAQDPANIQELQNEDEGQPAALVAGDNRGTEAFELIERDDLHGFIVSRAEDAIRRNATSESVSRRNSSGSTSFRWRPALQFRSWLDRVQPQQIPPDERASFRAQIAEIRAKLYAWEEALEAEQVVSSEERVEETENHEKAAGIFERGTDAVEIGQDATPEKPSYVT